MNHREEKLHTRTDTHKHTELHWRIKVLALSLYFTHVPCAVSTSRPKLWLRACRVCPPPNTGNTRASYTAHSTCLDSPVRAPCTWRSCGDSRGDLSGPAPAAPGDAWRGDRGEGGTAGGTGRSRRRRTARTSRWPPWGSSRTAGTWARPLCSADTGPRPPPAPGS